jgi:hypothetical protein
MAQQSTINGTANAPSERLLIESPLREEEIPDYVVVAVAAIAATARIGHYMLLRVLSWSASFCVRLGREEAVIALLKNISLILILRVFVGAQTIHNAYVDAILI